MSLQARLVTLYWLTKPGIIYGNVINTFGGFLLAANGQVDLALFFYCLVGIALVIASACVVNNYIDRDIDQHMARTKNRALAQRAISAPGALSYAAVLGLVGFAILAVHTNWLATGAAAVGYLFYVVFYSWSKRQSTIGTIVGSVAGAVPPVVGYVAASGQLNAGAWTVFVILVLWQMPHFYAIALYRLKDYKAAGLPVLPAVRGARHTKIQIIMYILAFTMANVLLSLQGYTGRAYALIMLALGGYWLLRGLRGFKAQDTTTWARGMFGFSLIVILAMALLWSISHYLSYYLG